MTNLKMLHVSMSSSIQGNKQDRAPQPNGEVRQERIEELGKLA